MGTEPQSACRQSTRSVLQRRNSQLKERDGGVDGRVIQAHVEAGVRVDNQWHWRSEATSHQQAYGEQRCRGHHRYARTQRAPPDRRSRQQRAVGLPVPTRYRTRARRVGVPHAFEYEYSCRARLQLSLEYRTRPAQRGRGGVTVHRRAPDSTRLMRRPSAPGGA